MGTELAKQKVFWDEPLPFTFIGTVPGNGFKCLQAVKGIESLASWVSGIIICNCVKRQWVHPSSLVFLPGLLSHLLLLRGLKMNCDTEKEKTLEQET